MVRALLFALVFYVTTALFVIVGSPLLFGPRSWAMAGLKAHALTCGWLLKLIVGIKLEVRGHDKLPPGPVLVACKHQSAWDTFGLIPLFADPAMIMKTELFWIPFHGWFSRKFEMIEVRRGRRTAAMRQLLVDAKTRTAIGREVLIFPEGTRRVPGAPADYKAGIVLLYEGLGLPCVPVALNSGLFWPRRSLWRYPGTIVVEFLEPIPADLPRAEFRARLQDSIERASDALLSEAARALTPPPLPPESQQRLAELEARARSHQIESI
jgi:1-acyl-sn-glycerol-3-phosphate acyltransferase